MQGIRYTNEKGYDLSIAVWLADDEYDHSPVEGPYISVTGLLKPDRMIVLDQRAKAMTAESDTIEEIDIDRYVASRLGSAIHSGIEHSWMRTLPGGLKLKAFMVALTRLGFSEEEVTLVMVNPSKEDLESNPNIIPVYMELRAYKKISGYTIGGKFDFIGNGTLEDFKSMGVYGYMKGDKDEEQLMQGSLYRWLNPNLVTEDVMKIQQIFTDWSKLEALKGVNRGYPQLRILAKELTLKPIKEIESWVRNKIDVIKSYANTPEAELPRCSPKDLWQTDPIYSYWSKPTNKRATKNFDKSEDAFTMLKDKGSGEVREKPGVVKRCGYCAAYDLCTQKDEYITANILQMP